MLSMKDITTVYETLLSSPGMNDSVKLSLHIPRKNVLLLVKIMEMALSLKEGAQNSLLGAVNVTWTNELTAIKEDVLKKSGLTEMNERLISLESK